MNSKLFKQLVGLLAVFMMTTQLALPVFAEDSMNDTGEIKSATESSEDVAMTNDDSSDQEDDSEKEVSLSEDIDESNAVEVLDSDLDDFNDKESDELIDKAVESLLDDLDGKSDTEIADAVTTIEEDIDETVAALESEAEDADPALQYKLRLKIKHLHDLRNKLRAKLLFKNLELKDKLVRNEKVRALYEFRWGNLTGQRKRCEGVDATTIREALKNRELPEGCQAENVQYTGTISADKGTLKVRKNLLFETNDKVTEDSGSSISFESSIAGAWDGLIVEFIPQETASTDNEKVKITISLGDLNETYLGAEVLGRKKIGNDHMLDIRHLGQAMSGQSNANNDKFVERKLKIDERVSKLREKLDEFRMLNRAEKGTDELDGVLDDAGEYNFDDTTAAELEAAIQKLNDSLNNEDSDNSVLEKATNLRQKLVELKAKAKERKFSNKLIPFKDTDDDQWFTKYVSKVKDKGIISGYKDAAGNDLGEFRPANKITVAEILKIGLETSGNGQEDSTIPNLKDALNHWAKGYVARGEELNLDLLKNETLDLNRPATRGEVIRMMLEALGITPDDISATSFSDLSVSDDNAKFIEYAKALGIVSGDEGKTTFRPDAPINRAEASKIANLILEIIMGDK